MATADEVRAAIARAQEAGDTEAVAVLTDHLAAMEAGPTRLQAAAQAAQAAGDTAAYDALTQALADIGGMVDASGQPTQTIDGRPIDRSSGQAMVRDGNRMRPVVSGDLEEGPADAPLPADIPGQPEYRTSPPLVDTFGETAAAMVEGPMQAARAFSGGLLDVGQSPSRNFLANDPLTSGLPSFALTGLGGIGDLGGAALSTIGAGISGGIGLASEAIPGQNSRQERSFADDVNGMLMFAIPELSGASSVPMRVASAAPRVAPQAAPVAAPVGPRIAAGRAAQEAGIPVFRTDIKPPETFIGRVAQRTGESIPLAGTGGMRAEQATARVEAARDFARQYGADSIIPAIDDVTANLLTTRSEEIRRLTGIKSGIVRALDAATTAIPTPRALKAIDAEITRISRGTSRVADQVVPILRQWAADLQGKSASDLEMIRKQFGDTFTPTTPSEIRGTGEAALSAIYGPLRDDIADAVGATAGPDALTAWRAANRELSTLAGELKDTTLRSILRRGEATPEVVRSALFSTRPSDLVRLRKSLGPEGVASARTAIVQEVLGRAGGLDELSPQKFMTALDKLGPQVKAFFDGPDLEAAQGLAEALRLTQRASVASAAPLTGIQTLPAAVSIGLTQALGLMGGLAGGVGIGTAARLYERTGVKSALRQVSQAKTPAAQTDAMVRLEAALRDAAPPTVAPAAIANENNDPYREMIGRY
ncbi:MAG: hypothetical protein U5N55_04915 [Cypionkella sp.]|nr:hypothetical protein [Cypionkella sp.]